MSAAHSSSKQPILVFSESISFGHIVRPLIVSKWLKSLNLPIIVACSKEASSVFETEGFETTHIRIADAPALYRRIANGGRMYKEKELYFKDDDLLIQAIKPQLIVSDFRVTALQLAKSHNIPSVGISSASCHPNYNRETSLPDCFAQPNFIPVSFFETLLFKTSFLGQGITKRLLRCHTEPLDKASEKYNLHPLPTFYHYVSQGDICLLADHPSVMPINNLRPQDIYIGPLRYLREEPLPEELSCLTPERKLIYISVGTQDSLRTDFLKSFIEGLLSRNCQVILSRGKRNFHLEINPTLTKNNFFAYDFISEDKLLDSVDLFVHHGGSLSTYQGLLRACPMIAIPANSDQHYHAEAIERLNVGHYFLPSRMRNQQLLDAAFELLDNSQTIQIAQTLQKKLLEFSGREQTLNKITHLLS